MPADESSLSLWQKILYRLAVIIGVSVSAVATLAVIAGLYALLVHFIPLLSPLPEVSRQFINLPWHILRNYSMWQRVVIFSIAPVFIIFGVVFFFWALLKIMESVSASTPSNSKPAVQNTNSYYGDYEKSPPDGESLSPQGQTSTPITSRVPDFYKNRIFSPNNDTSPSQRQRAARATPSPPDFYKEYENSHRKNGSST